MSVVVLLNLRKKLIAICSGIDFSLLSRHLSRWHGVNCDKQSSECQLVQALI